MKVLIIHTTYKYQGGEDSVVMNEMALLKSNGVEVELLQFDNDEKTLLKVLQMPFNISSYFATINKLKQYQPDVVHIHNLHFAGSASVLYALKRMRVPVVMTLHNYRLLCPSATLYFNDQIFDSSINKAFPGKAVKHGVYKGSRPITGWMAASMYLHQMLGTWNIPDRYFVLGEHSRSIFASSKLDKLADRMVVKPNFCYPVAEDPIRHNYYLFVGRLTVEKGISTLLKAFAENGLPLKIAGAGPLEDEVRRYSEKHKNIVFLGEQSKQVVGRLAAAAKALIFTSVWYETFGMVIIEAFSAGTPVIASAIGQPANMIVDRYNGLHFEPGNTDDLKAKVALYESLPDYEREQYRHNARQTYLEKYTPEQNARMLINAYQSVLQDRVLDTAITDGGLKII